MAIHADVEWEVRSTGAATNGGGFYDKNPGTSVDYSQQDAAQLALSDIASDGAGTGISSATGGFTDAMEGNAIFLDGGTGFTKGWYIITGWTDTNNITIDRSAGVSKTGGTGNVGGGWMVSGSAADVLFFNDTNKADYNTVWWKSGTYTATWTIQISANWLRVLGYDTTHGDDPTGTDRPYLDFGAGGTHYYLFLNSSSDQTLLKNFRVSCRASASAVAAISSHGSNTIIINVKAERLNFNAPAFGLYGETPSVIQCHAISDTGDGFLISNSDYGMFQYCYAEAALAGFTYSGSSWGTFIENCIAAGGVDGIKVSVVGRVHNCTAYDCSGYGIYLLNGGGAANNIVEGCGTGVRGDAAAYASNHCLYNNTTDYDNFKPNTYGFGDVTADPAMVDPANGDFTLGPTSPCFDVGMGLGAGTGL